MSEEPSENPTNSEEPSENPTNSEEPSEFPTQSQEPTDNDQTIAEFICDEDNENLTSLCTAIRAAPLIFAILSNDDFFEFPEFQTIRGFDLIDFRYRFPTYANGNNRERNLQKKQRTQLTMFAPTNNALNKLFRGSIRSLFDAGRPLVVNFFGSIGIDFLVNDMVIRDFLMGIDGRLILNEILLAHIINKEVVYDELKCDKIFDMLIGSTETQCLFNPNNNNIRAKYQVGDGNTRENRPRIIDADNQATNGVTHVIDEVILPNFVLPIFDDDSVMPPADPNLFDYICDTRFTPVIGVSCELLQLFPDIVNLLEDVPEHDHTVRVNRDAVIARVTVILDGIRAGRKLLGKGGNMISSVIEQQNNNDEGEEPAQKEQNISPRVQGTLESKSNTNDLNSINGIRGKADSSLLTVFVPSNSAFVNLPEKYLESLLKIENQGILKDIILYHIIPEQVREESLTCGGTRTMLNGETTVTHCRNKTGIKFQVGQGNSQNNEPEIVSENNEASNGVFHVVDEVILPLLPTSSPISSPTSSPVAPSYD